MFNEGDGFLTGCDEDENNALSLPDGLVLAVSADRQTCVISGTPTTTEAIRPALYVITATNNAGSKNTTVEISVEVP